MPWASIRAYGWNVWILALLSSLLWSRGELPLVRWKLGDQAVAHYAVSLSLYAGAVQGVMLWTSGLAPHLTAEWGQGRVIQACALSRRFSDLQVLVAAMGGLCLTAAGPELLGRVFGAEYASHQVVLTLLSLGLVTLCSSAPNFLIQIATDARFNRNVSIGGLICLYPVAWVGMSGLGLNGAAVARIVIMMGIFLAIWLKAKHLWGERLISLPNVGLVLVLVAGVGFAGAYGATLTTRIGLALGALIILVFGLRTATQHSVCAELVAWSWSRWQERRGHS